MRSDFEAALAAGEQGEEELSRYFESKRIPYFRAAHARGETGGASIRIGRDRIIVPDFQTFTPDGPRWAECKRYMQREFWRTGQWAGSEFHGLSWRVVEHYRRCRDLTRWPVDLYIVEPNGILLIEDFLVSATLVKLGDGRLAQIPLHQFRSLS
jgi:hypothetical protein